MSTTSTQSLVAFQELMLGVMAAKGLKKKWEENHTDESLHMFWQVAQKSNLSVIEMRRRLLLAGDFMPTLRQFSDIIKSADSTSDYVVIEQMKDFATKIVNLLIRCEYPKNPTGNASLDLYINRKGGMHFLRDRYAEFSQKYRFKDWLAEYLVDLLKHPPPDPLAEEKEMLRKRLNAGKEGATQDVEAPPKPRRDFFKEVFGEDYDGSFDRKLRKRERQKMEEKQRRMQDARENYKKIPPVDSRGGGNG